MRDILIRFLTYGMYSKRVFYLTLNLVIILTTCLCCIRSGKYTHTAEKQETNSMLPVTPLPVVTNKYFQACVLNGKLVKYCYNKGYCVSKKNPLNDTHYEPEIYYCECALGFGGETCREDNRFLEASIFSGVIALIVVFIVIFIVVVKYNCKVKSHGQKELGK